MFELGTMRNPDEQNTSDATRNAVVSFPSSLNDEQTEIDRARHGDLKAFERLVRRHESRVFSFLVRWLGDQDAAEDVLQEATFRAFRNLHRFRAHASFRPWFFKIAVNEAKSFLRKESRLCRRHEAFHQDEQTRRRRRPSERLRAISVLEKGLGTLSPADRQLLLLRYGEELSLAEMSDILDVRVFVLKMRIHRARQRFRKAVAITDQEAPP